MNAMSEKLSVPGGEEAASTGKINTYDARGLIEDGPTARILLDSQTYYLRITRAGKLILTK